MRRLTWVIGAVAGVLAAAPAHAAAPLDLGVGQTPSAVIDAAGTAHIAFASPGGQTYCRLPRQAAACDVLTALPTDAAWGRVKILRRATDGALFTVQGSTSNASHSWQTWLRSSVDNGATWSAPIVAGIGLWRLDDVALSADGGSILAFTSNAASMLLQADPLTGTEVRTIDLNLTPSGAPLGKSVDGRVVQTATGRVLAVIDGIGQTGWRTFGGGDLYDQNAWQPFPGGRIRNEGSPELTTGPRGTYLLNKREVPAQRGPAAPFVIRSFDERRNRWRAPKPAGEDRLVYSGAVALQADGGRRLHLGWASGDPGTTRSCVSYARTSPRRSSWFGRTTTLFRTADAAQRPVSLAIAAGADGRGVAVWGDQGATTGAGHVRVTVLKQRGGRYRRIADSYDRPYC